MRKALLLLLLCCIGGIAMAETRKKIDLEKNDNPIRPLSIIYAPTAYQADATISIQLPDTSSYVTVSVVNNETGMEAYSMIYAGTDLIQITLENEMEGTYTLHLNIEGTEYIGYFML